MQTQWEINILLLRHFGWYHIFNSLFGTKGNIFQKKTFHNYDGRPHY